MSEASSLCYFPTTVFLVDDDRDFSESVAANLDHPHIRIFDDPMAALNAMDEFNDSWQVLNHVPHEQDGKQSMGVFDMAFRPAKHQICSVLLVDYTMPQMNGLKFCQIVKDKFVQKILLTGHSDGELAIEAFNTKCIDHFIHKNTPHLPNVVNQCVDSHLQRYFKKRCHSLFSSLSAQDDFWLNTSEHQCFFQEIRDYYQIEEYYLVDQQGSFFMLDKQRRGWWLVIRHITSIEALYQTASYYGQNQGSCSSVFDDTLQALKDKLQVPFFYGPMSCDLPPTKWHQLMHPVSKLPQNQSFYYTIVPAFSMEYIGTHLTESASVS